MTTKFYSHRYNTSYWANLDQFGWTEEIGGMKAMITKYAGIPAEDIMGKQIISMQRLEIVCKKPTTIVLPVCE